MKSQIIFFVFILITISCATRKDFPLTYGNICSDITLNSNKTFEYREACTGLGGEFIRKGTWKQGVGDTILLNTNEQPENLITTYKGKINPKLKGKVRIQVSDKSGALGFVNVLINDKEQGVGADENGIAEFDSKLLNNITYNFLRQEETIKINNPKYNEIDMTIRDLDLDIVQNYFINMPIVVTGRKLVFYPNTEEKRFVIKRK